MDVNVTTVSDDTNPTEFSTSVVTVANLTDLSTFERVSVILHCVEAWLGAFLNVLTIISILKFEKLCISSHILILCLSCSDCLPFIARIFTILNVTLRENVGIWIKTCVIQTFFLTVSNALSVNTIAAIATERAISIIYPIQARNHLSIRIMQRVAVCMWIIFISLGIICITRGRQPELVVVHCKWKEIYKAEYISYFLNGGFFVASLVTLTMYMAILRKIGSLRSKVTAINNSDKRQQTQVKMCRMMGTGNTPYGLFTFRDKNAFQ